MSRQVDKKIDNLDKKFANVLEITGFTEQGDFAMQCKIQPGTLSKALERSSFSADIVDKIFDRFRVRKKYWYDGKEPVIEEKPTSVQNEAAIPEKPLRAYNAELQDLIEGKTEYLVIPRSVLKDNYRIVPLEQFEKDKRQMEKDAKELDSRIKEIEGLHDIIKDITSRPINIQLAQPQKAK